IAERGKRVVHPEPFAARLDEPGAAQVREMARRLRLRDVQGLMDVADADLAGQQQAQDPQPRRIGQRPEERLHLAYLPCPLYASANIFRPWRRCKTPCARSTPPPRAAAPRAVRARSPRISIPTPRSARCPIRRWRRRSAAAIRPR